MGRVGREKHPAAKGTMNLKNRNQSAAVTGMRPVVSAVAIAAFLAVAGCQGSGLRQTTQHGYVVTPTALEQVPVGSSKDQVLIALGSPSTTGSYGNEVFYYISQTRERAAAFMPDRVVEQRIVAVYFDANSNVERIANYGLQDGKVFDFISRTTPTGGADQNFLQQVLTGVIGFGTNPFGR
jgi:outer membrane protein assembly factor BamE (lipoprotein component of BamABCDE complex)